MYIIKKSTFFAITACVLWSTAFAAIKIGLRYTTPLHLAGMRFVIAGLIILPFCRNYKSNFKAAWLNRKYILTIAALQTFGLYSLFHVGISMVPAAVTAIIIGAGPLFIAIFAHFINDEPFSRKKGIAISVGFSGIAIIALARFGGFISAEISWLGFGILVLANISGSLGNVFISKNKIPAHPVFINSIQLLTGGMGILILSFFLEGFNFKIQPPGYYAALAWLSMIAAVGFSLWFVVLKTPGVKVSEINLWKFILPVLGATLSWILLPDEKPETIVIAGILLVGISLVIMYYRKTK